MAEKYSWEITAQATNQVTVNQASNVVEGVIVYFRTGEGNEGSVFVPNAVYNVTRVKAMVSEAARKLDDVGRLAVRPGEIA